MHSYIVCRFELASSVLQASYFSNWSHQAVDFILGNTIQSLDLQTNNLIPELQFPFIGSLCCTYETNVCSCSSSYNNMLALFLHTQASLKKLISMGRTLESVEESISFMITQLIARMCTPFKGNGSFSCLSMILTVFLFLVIISHRCCCVFTYICCRGETTRN